MHFIFDGSSQKKSRLFLYNLVDRSEKEIINIDQQIVKEISDAILVEDDSYSIIFPENSKIINPSSLLNLLAEQRLEKTKVIFFIRNESLLKFLAMCIFPLLSYNYQMGKILPLDIKKELGIRYHLSLKSQKSRNIALIFNEYNEEISSHHLLIKHTCSVFSKNLFLMSIGILTEQKLANFPQIDLFIIPSAEIPHKISTTYSLINTYEFVSGCFDMFFSTNYGNLHYFSELIKSHSTDLDQSDFQNDINTEQTSFYGLENPSSFQKEIIRGDSGWSRTYNHELS
jgi:hypothetical protein